MICKEILDKIRSFNGKLNLEDLAKQVKLSKMTVYYLCRRYNISYLQMPRGRPIGSGHPVPSTQKYPKLRDKDFILPLIIKGESLDAIGKAVGGATRERVRQVLQMMHWGKPHEHRKG